MLTKDAALLRRNALAGDGEDVIPTVLVEQVGQQRRAQDLANLRAAQAGLDLRHHLLRDHIALHDLDAVGFEHAKHVLGRGRGVANSAAGRQAQGAKHQGCTAQAGIREQRQGCVLSGDEAIAMPKQQLLPGDPDIIHAF